MINQDVMVSAATAYANRLVRIVNGHPSHCRGSRSFTAKNNLLHLKIQTTDFFVILQQGYSDKMTQRTVNTCNNTSAGRK